MQPMSIVHDIYTAFGRGDIPAILEHMAPDVAWEPGLADHGVPWLTPGSGTAHASDFFRIVTEELEFGSFQPVAFLDGGNQVAVVVDVDAVARRTGQAITDREIHLWTFDDDDRVVALRHFLDTHQHVIAAGTATDASS